MPIFSEEISALQIAQALDAVKFEVTKASDSTIQRLICDTGSALQSMPLYDKNQLAQELNEAIAPVIARRRDKYIGKVKRAVEPYERDDKAE